jgi:uncharacterized protein related to proFAR isomerase
MEEHEIGFKVCPHCYSTDLQEKTLVGGPMAHLDYDDRSYKCFNCGRTSVPMEFGTVQDYQDFVVEKTIPLVEVVGEFLSVPLLPLETGGRAFERLYAEANRPMTSVVQVVWDGEGLMPTGLASPLTSYWQTITKKVYMSKEAAFLDLGGINEGSADVEGMRRAMKRKNDIWLDIGLRGEQDVFDAFLMGADRMLVTSIGTASMETFRKAIDLSDRVVPCLCCDPKVRWRRQRGAEEDPERVVAALESMGYRTIGFLDLNRLGRGQGLERYWAGNVSRLIERPIIGGGVTLADRETLMELGAGGALLDPFGPEVMAHLE